MDISQNGSWTGPKFDPYHVEFLKLNNPPSIFGTVYYHFKGNQDENLKLISQQYRAWSDLALYWWQRSITFGVGRIRVNKFTRVIKVNA